MDHTDTVSPAQGNTLRLAGQRVHLRTQLHLCQTQAGVLVDEVRVGDAVLFPLNHIGGVGRVVAVYVDDTLVFLIVRVLIEEAHAQALGPLAANVALGGQPVPPLLGRPHRIIR